MALTEQLARERTRILAAYSRREQALSERTYFGYDHAAHLVRQQERHRATLALLSRSGIERVDEATVLDVGCGEGDGLCDFLRWGAHVSGLAGVDLRPDVVERAKSRLGSVDVRVACGSALPFDDGAFSIVQQLTVFSSILDPELRHGVAREMMRVTAPGGCILSYDMRRANPQNRDVAAVTRSDLIDLFPQCEIMTRSLTLLPHRVRNWPGGLLEFVQPWLRKLGFGQTHLLAVIRPVGGGGIGQ